MSTTGTFASLRVRSFRWYLMGTSVSMTGSWLTLIAQSLLVYELTSSGVLLGVIGACQFLPVIVFSSWAGLVADRYDRRRVLLVLQSAALLQAVALALVATMDSPPVALLCAFAALRGTTATFDLPVRRSMVVETVPAHLAGNAIALNSATMASALVFGSALGGALVALVGYSLAFLTDGVTYVAALVSLWRIRPADLRSAPLTPRRAGQLREGLAVVRSTATLRVALTLTALTGFGYNFPVVLPILVTEGFGRPTTSFTYLYSALSVGSVSGALLIARRPSVDLRLLARLALGFGLATVALGVNPVFALAFPIAMSVGMCGYAFLSAMVTLLQTIGPVEMRGRILGFHSIASVGVWAVTAPIVGWTCETVGPRLGIAATGCTCVLAAGWARLQDPGRRAPAAAAPATVAIRSAAVSRPESLRSQRTPTSRFRRSPRAVRARSRGAGPC